MSIVGVAILQLVLAGGDTSYAAAYKTSADSGKPLVILIGADWCPHCVEMKRSSIPQALKQASLDDAAFAIVNSDDEPQLARQLMSGSSIPQLVMFYKTADGWKRAQLTGGQTPSQIATFVRDGVKQTAASNAIAGKPAASTTGAN